MRLFRKRSQAPDAQAPSELAGLGRPLLLNTLLMLAAGSASVAALDDEVLWLPASYQVKLAPELREAALRLEATERCERLMRGSLHDSTRGIDNAVFLLVCRDTQHKTYSVLADANTLELTYVVPPEPPAVEEEQPQPDAAELLRARVDALRQECEQLFVRKTRFMKKLKRVQAGSEDPQVDEQGAITIYIPFDAESLQGKPLNYAAECSSAAPGAPASFVIKARKIAIVGNSGA